MEMVEAIIDNKYEANQYDQDSDSLRMTSARVYESNPEDTTVLREPVKTQMAKSNNTRRRKLHKKGKTKSSHLILA